ncbi:DUF4112 domain-containing protein [Azospirillum sp. TSO22-1]|uniref:DUF4112 domain-containing protein n=1 Tax=Azospirillum sp. TSO22-1 TaxID=716789 RepID=UPI000D603D8B|nr:DUF4112 domain-containing protein [Azospirillum sp. TSO22-1]PWC43587.1 hypothetical protein TSO221_19760 [Azospirillum sp. TSO22-1]
MSMASPYARRPRAESVDRLERLDRLRRLARLLDNRWTIPGTRIGFGLDGIASLVPVAGDTLTALVSLHILDQARRMGVPKRLIARMLGNVLFDWAAGSIPVIGTVFDVAFKSNLRNLRLLEQHLEEGMRVVTPR